MLLQSLMKLKIYVFIFWLLSTTAQSGIFDSSNACSSQETPSLKFEGGVVTQCGQAASVYMMQKKNPDGSEQGVFVSGKAADNLTKKLNPSNFETDLTEKIETLKNRVFPIVDRTGQILGTAFRYGKVTLTALHVVVTASPQEPLFVFDSEQNASYAIRGYAPVKRVSEVVNTITPIEDVCILDIPELSDAPSFTSSPTPLSKRFQYLELSYPKDKNSLNEPSAFSSFISLPKADSDGLAILNRNGQDFNSSGGPVINAKTGQVRAMTICIEPHSNSVKAIDLNLVNKDIETALALGFVPDLSGTTYEFTYSKKCIPVGGRGGGP